jgi:hypothetical protein
MRSIIAYTIHASNKPQYFAESVNAHLAQGWQPYGSISANPSFEFVQVMVKYAVDVPAVPAGTIDNPIIERFINECTTAPGSAFDKQKFAELIIKECDRYVAEHLAAPGDLQKHFGLE